MEVRSIVPAASPDRGAERRERPALALVLSGGAVRGGAHIGVLAVLEERGVRPDLILGVSAGAVVGVAAAAGLPATEIAHHAREQSWLRLTRPALGRRRALLELRGAERLLREELGLTTFDRLQTRFAAVACDLGRGVAVRLDQGDVVDAVLASAAIPGLFAGREIGGRTLVDGGVVDNLPTDEARRMGAEVIVSVDLLQLPTGDDARPPDSLLETWQRSLYYLVRRGHPPVGEHEVRIVPRLVDCSFTDFKEMDEIVRRGREAAEAAWPEIARLLAGDLSRSTPLP